MSKLTRFLSKIIPSKTKYDPVMISMIKRTPGVSLAQINEIVDKLSPQIAEIIEYSDPIAFHEVFSHPLALSDLYKEKPRDIEPDILQAERELLNDYNEFKQLLLQILKNGYHLNILNILPASRGLDKLLESLDNEQKPNSEQNLGTEFNSWLADVEVKPRSELDFAIDSNSNIENLQNSFHTAVYTSWLFYEIKEFQKKRKNSPAEESNDRGYKYAQRGDFRRALSYYRKAIEISPSFSLAWINAGIALKNIGEYNAAIEVYDYVIRNIDGTYKKAWHNKAVALQHKGDKKGALECCEKALEIDSFYEAAIRLKLELDNPYIRLV